MRPPDDLHRSNVLILENESKLPTQSMHLYTFAQAPLFSQIKLASGPQRSIIEAFFFLILGHCL